MGQGGRHERERSGSHTAPAPRAHMGATRDGDRYARNAEPPPQAGAAEEHADASHPASRPASRPAHQAVCRLRRSSSPVGLMEWNRTASPLRGFTASTCDGWVGVGDGGGVACMGGERQLGGGVTAQCPCEARSLAPASKEQHEAAGRVCRQALLPDAAAPRFRCLHRLPDLICPPAASRERGCCQ